MGRCSRIKLQHTWLVQPLFTVIGWPMSIQLTRLQYIITFMPQVLDPPPNLEALVLRQQKVYDDLKARSDLVDESQEKGCAQ
jgi:hypothetical protein